MSQDAQLQVSQDKLAPFRHAMMSAQKAFEDAIPTTFRKYLTPERLTKITLSAISRNPYLLKCTPTSVLRAVMDSASLGLEPTGGVLGQAYMVPYKMYDKHTKQSQYEAQLIVGYRGYITLARRSGEIVSVESHVVHQHDHFDIEFGREPKLSHKPSYAEDPGPPIAAYCVAEFRDGAKHCEFMTKAEIDKVRDRSRAKDNGPWVTDYEEMAKKTVVRRAAKYWPLSIEMAKAFEIEDTAESGTVYDMPPDELEEKKPQTQQITERIKKGRKKREEPEDAAPSDEPPPHDPQTGEVLQPGDDGYLDQIQPFDEPGISG